MDADAPLSVIDWLDEIAVEEPVSPADATLNAPVTQSGAAPSIEAQPLDDATGPGVGLLPANVSGLPSTLWSGADLDTVTSSFSALPPEALPPVQEVRKRLLLAAAAPPAKATSEEFLLARVAMLRELGLVSEALELLAEAEPLSPASFAEFTDLTLLTATEGQACARLQAEPSLSDDLAMQIFCLARGSDWSAAALTLQTGEVIGDISPNMGLLLAQFLDPEIADGTSPPLPEGPVSPLTMRLYEAIGLPLASRDLPRAFAVSDLRPELGWKGQLEAAERLARTGAVTANQLLGLYTLRVPAASGGVWDRASALQELETALQGGSAREISRTLDAASFEMREAGLDTTFAAMFADRLIDIDQLSEGAESTRRRLLLLSDRYEEAPDLSSGLIAGVAQGDATGQVAKGAVENAILAAFVAFPPAATQETTLGLEILAALQDIELARDGDLSKLTVGLNTLRRLGLEDAARRTALHLLLEG